MKSTELKTIIAEFKKIFNNKPDEFLQIVSYANEITYPKAEEEFCRLKHITNDNDVIIKERIKIVNYQIQHLSQHYLRYGAYPDSYKEMMFNILRK